MELHIDSVSLTATKRVLDGATSSLARYILNVSSEAYPERKILEAVRKIEDHAARVGELYKEKSTFPGTLDDISAPILSKDIEVTEIPLPPGGYPWYIVNSQTSGSTLFITKNNLSWNKQEVLEVNPYQKDAEAFVSSKSRNELRFGKRIVFDCVDNAEDSDTIYRVEDEHEEHYLYRHEVYGDIKNLRDEFPLYDETGSSFFCGKTLHIIFETQVPGFDSPGYYTLCHMIRDRKTNPVGYVTYQGHLSLSEFMFRGRLYARRHVLDIHNVLEPLKFERAYETYDVKSGMKVDFFDFLGTSVHDQQFVSKDGYICVIKNGSLFILE
jgi:hypothetical protein